MNWYKTAQHQSRTTTVQDAGSYMDIVPIIALKGKWLLNAGFYPKDKLQVSVSDEQIVLTIAEKSEHKRQMQKEIELSKQNAKEQQSFEQKIRIP